jgi:hypothetical protein
MGAKAMETPMTTWTIIFRADEYVENRLRQDEWEITCGHDAEAARFAAEKISGLYGVPPRSGRIAFETPRADYSNVLLDGKCVGIVSFDDNGGE